MYRPAPGAAWILYGKGSLYSGNQGLRCMNSSMWGPSSNRTENQVKVPVLFRKNPIKSFVGHLWSSLNHRQPYISVQRNGSFSLDTESVTLQTRQMAFLRPVFCSNATHTPDFACTLSTPLHPSPCCLCLFPSLFPRRRFIKSSLPNGPEVTFLLELAL